MAPKKAAEAPVHSKLALEVANAKGVSMPLLLVSSLDYHYTIQSIRQVLEADPRTADLRDDKGNKIPLLMVQWDTVRGLTGINQKNQEILNQIFAHPKVKPLYENLTPDNLVLALQIAYYFPEHSTLFIHNLQDFMLGQTDNAAAVRQALALLREPYKKDNRTVVGLVPEAEVPINLQQDFTVLEEELPSRDQLKRIVINECKAAAADIPTFKLPSDKELEQAVDELAGLASFAAEATVAFAITEKGLDLKALGKRRRKLISSTPGLSILSDDVTLEDVGGLAEIKQFLIEIFEGNNRPSAIVLVDEIEKIFGAASQGDSSGVSQGYLGALLTEMQENKYRGLLFTSPPGCGKSLIAKAIGNHFGVPVILMDINGMKEKFVGSSEQNFRRALKVIKAISGGRAFFIGTSNSFAGLPPELVRRFRFGTWFVDLPDADEREAVWKLSIRNNNLEEGLVDVIPESDGWSSANIADACILASDLRIPLSKAAKRITPAYNQHREKIDRLREEANGRWLDASKEGLYKLNLSAPRVNDNIDGDEGEAPRNRRYKPAGATA